MPAGLASLPMPQWPLSPSSCRSRFTLLPQPSGPFPLSQLLPAQKAAHGPPCARILIAWNDCEAALQLKGLLRELDYAVVGPAGTREEVERLIGRPSAIRRPVDCALVHVGMPEAAAIADRLACQSVPLVWLLPDCSAILPSAHAHAPVLDRPFDRAAVVAAINEAERHQASRRRYVTPPPQPVWPRVFPQL